MSIPRRKFVIIAVAVLAVAVLISSVMLFANRDRRQNVARGREWSRLLRENSTFSAQRPA